MGNRRAAPGRLRIMTQRGLVRPAAGAARSRAFLFLACAAVVVAPLGCALPGQRAGDPFEAERGEEIEILVRNRNFSQVTVYTARAGSGQRLGIVPGLGEATFKLRWFLPDIRLRVRPLAGNEFYTETITVAPGEVLELVVPSR